MLPIQINATRFRIAFIIAIVITVSYPIGALVAMPFGSAISQSSCEVLGPSLQVIPGQLEDLYYGVWSRSDVTLEKLTTEYLKANWKDASKIRDQPDS